MTSQAERWLLEFDREALGRFQSCHLTYVAAWRCYRDGLTPAEAVEMIARDKGSNECTP